MTQKHHEIEEATLATERASDELRRQLGVMIQSDSQLFAMLPVESADDAMFAALSGAALVITAVRAQQLGLTASEALRIDASALSLPQIRSIANPLADVVALPHLESAPATEVERLAVALAKYAGLLPAVLMAPAAAKTAPVFELWHRVEASAIRTYQKSPLLEVVQVAGATLPIAGAENTRIESFRSRFGTSVHLALIIGTPESTDAPLVRVHSSCVTGDILGSLRCDCGDQLRLALDAIRAAGHGVLIYLHQEGRGIGIVGKLRAYQLQERGLDTYDANLALGFDEDERDFSIASAMLKQLGIHRIRLLTNNPQKITALKAAGMVVAERVALVADSGAHNHMYLKAKKDFGHLS